MKKRFQRVKQRPKQLLHHSLYLLSLLVILANGCTSEKAPAPDTGSNAGCDTMQITSAYVMTAVQMNCTNRNCHPGGNSPAVADFSTLNKLKGYISNRVDIFRLRATGPTADMPQSQSFPPLTRGMRDSIGCWISRGMPD